MASPAGEVNIYKTNYIKAFATYSTGLLLPSGTP